MLRFTAFPTSSRVVAAVLVLAAVLALVSAGMASAAAEAISVSGAAEVNEDGNADITVQLTESANTDPTNLVSVAISSNNNDVSLSPPSLTFAEVGEDQTVTVTARDNDVDVDASVTLTFTSSSSDAAFDDLTATYTLTINDNDTAGVTLAPSDVTLPNIEEKGGSTSYTAKLDTQPVGGSVKIAITTTLAGRTISGDDVVTVSPASLTFTASNWNKAQTVKVTARDNDVDASDETVVLSHAISGGDYGAVTIADKSVTVTDDDTKGVTVDPATLAVNENGGAAAYTVVLDSEPTAAVTVAVGSVTGATMHPTFLRFTASDWNTAQTVTVTGGSVDSDSELTVTNTANNAGGYSTGESASVIVTVRNLEAGILLNPESALSVPEDGSASYTVALKGPPTGGAVTVTITATGEGADAATVSRSSLTFRASNWDQAQTVRVTGVDNHVDADSDASLTLTHTASSGYGENITAELAVTVTDDDTNGVTVKPASLSVNENGDTGAYTVVLDAEPTADVTVTVSAGDGATAAPTTLDFTASDWNTPQTVTVTGGSVANDSTVTVSNTAGSTGGYDGSESANVTVTVLDLNPGVRFSPASLAATVVNDDVTTSYTVELRSKPARDVTIAITSDDTDTATVSPASLTFTPGNWNHKRTVTVTVKADGDGSNDNATLTHAISSKDASYEALESSTVSLSVTDNALGDYVIRPAVLNIRPGGAATFTVARKTPGSETLTITADSTTVATVSPVSLAFTAADEISPKSVTVTGVAEGETTITVGDSGKVSVIVKKSAPPSTAGPAPAPAAPAKPSAAAPAAAAPATPPAPAVIGMTHAATATEASGGVLITRHDGGASLAIAFGGFIRDESMGQTYQVVRRADGMIVRQWVSPNSPLVYQIPWAVVNTQFTVPVSVILTIPLDDQVGSPGQLARRFDGGDDRIFSYDAELGQWRHVPDIPTFQALGLYWCDVTAADSGFFDRISIGPAHPATDMPASSDYPNCSTG